MENSQNNVSSNSKTTFNTQVDYPDMDVTAYVHPLASIIGQVVIGEKVFIAPFASIRGDEGLKIHIGNYCNIQDGVVLHGLKNFENKNNIKDSSVFTDNEPFSIYVDNRVTMAHQCQIHGPAYIGSNVFIGMQSLVFNSTVNEGVVLEPGSKVIDVTIPANRYVSAGQIVTSQQDADALPQITSNYKYNGFNEKVVSVNLELAKGYSIQYKH